jgi:hypothetical protein
MNPYSNLPASAFWKTAVAEKSMLEIDGLWRPKFALTKQARISTYGSCVAQHIGRALKSRGYGWLIAEPPPPGMAEASAREFNYGIFSSRTANIYTTTLLCQWLSWAMGEAPPAEVWRAGDRFIDPFRPRIEPDGFESEEELVASRLHAIACFRESVASADVFVFTLGLTESWRNARDDYEYPMCPGTVGGDFDAGIHQFRNLGYQEVLDSLEMAIRLVRQVNPSIRVILTVSPVPLTATRSGQHVLVATMASKSILRAVAGQLERNDPGVDYFPSYEIISSPPFRGAFFEANLRGVASSGVGFVMDSFFSAVEGGHVEAAEECAPAVPRDAKPPPQDEADDIHCEEEFLEAFVRKPADG